MKSITPETLLDHSFSKIKSGYDPAEVDAYIHRLVESFSILHRENTVLLNKLHAIENAQATADNILKNAQAQKDKIIEDAYLKADNILASVQMNCDYILRNYKEKAEAQKKILSDMKKAILKFKNDLFEQYRLHIEIIENLSPSDDDEDNWSPDNYAQHIVAELKKKFSDQYEIFPETQMEFPFWAECKKETDPEISKKRPISEQHTCDHPSKKKIVKKNHSVMNMIDEYQHSSSKGDAKISSAQQFMLDFDNTSEKGVVIDK